MPWRGGAIPTALPVEASSWSPSARATSAVTRSARSPTPATTWRCWTICSAGHEQAVPNGVTLVRARIHDHDAVKQLLVDHRADAVMHFAAWLAVGESVQKPIDYYQNNVTGTLTVLGAMRDAGVKRFIFSSTCAVYGEPQSVPIVETLPKKPINAYGETKLTDRARPAAPRTRLRDQVDRPAIFQRRRRASGRHHRRGSCGRSAPDPIGHPRRQRRHAAARVWRGLSDARRHLPA